MEPQVSRAEVERRYRERLQRAREGYEASKSAAETAFRELQEVALPEPDGSQAYRNALVAETAASRAYRKALREFTDLTVHGKVADEPQD